MSQWIVSISEDCAQRVTPDTNVPLDPRFVIVQADSSAEAFAIARQILQSKEPKP